MSATDIIVKNKLLSYVVFKTLHLKNRGYKQLFEERCNADLFDYKTIAQPLPNSYEEICPDNNCFGIGFSLRNYCGWKKSYINKFVEHGYFFGSYVSAQETNSFSKQILTFGDVRKKHIEAKINKDAIPIGPYIHYASQYYSDERLAKVKKELGRVLLVFFSHSGTGCSVSFDLDYIISKIESIRKSFDTVVVSVFWSDINDELVKRLEGQGYKIFSAGNRYDNLFMSRLKTMISLADVTMSNSVSTHIAYCTYLKRPHWFIKQEVIEKAESKKAEENVRIGVQIKKDDVAINERKEIEDAFEVFSEILKPEQIEVCNKYFGFDYVKTPEEMKAILK